MGFPKLWHDKFMRYRKKFIMIKMFVFSIKWNFFFSCNLLWTLFIFSTRKMFKNILLNYWKARNKTCMQTKIIIEKLKEEFFSCFHWLCFVFRLKQLFYNYLFVKLNSVWLSQMNMSWIVNKVIWNLFV